MRVKNLVIANTQVVETLIRESNFKFLVTTRPNGYRVLEKRYIKYNYSMFKKKKYFIPGTETLVDTCCGYDVGSIIRSRWVLPLWFYERKKEIPQEEIAVLEKKLNSKR